MDSATYLLASNRQSQKRRIEPDARTMLSDPRMHAFFFATAAWLWMFVLETMLDYALDAGALSATGYRRMVFACALPLAVTVYFVIKHHIVARADAEGRLRCITDALPRPCALVNADGVVQHANTEFLRKVSPTCAPLAHTTLETLITPLLLSAHGGVLLPARGDSVVDIGLKGRDGVVRRSGIEIRKLAFKDHDLGWIATLADDAEPQELRAENILKSQALDIAMDVIAIADLRETDMPLVYVNRAFEDITGYPPREALGRNLAFLHGNDRGQPEIAVMRDCMARLQPVVVTMRNYRRDGTMFWNQIRLSVAHDSAGRPSHYVCVMRDVTELTQSAQNLKQLARMDQTTGLYNRAHFTEALTERLPGAEANTLIVAIEVSRLEEITRGFGEAASDKLLAGVADRLRALPGDAIIGRLDGNTFGFAIVLAGSARSDGVVEDVRRALRDPFGLPDGEMQILFAVSTALGGAGVAASTVVHQALAALRQASRPAPGAVHTFSATSDEDLKRRLGLSRDLHHAIGGGDFALHLQPCVSLGDGRWMGAEALVRWRHPTFGLQSPALFLSVSEQTGQILEIDAWALRNAAALVKRLNDESRTPLTISVNLSSLRLDRCDLASMLRDILASTGADASMLKLELAERILVGDDSEIVVHLQELRAMGFGIVIDDFGAGASSLSTLNRLPVTEIKIDRNFIRGCENCTYRQIVISSFVAIGRSLNIDVTAKGVETEAQSATLQRLGVRQAQGFLFGSPIDTTAFLDLAYGRAHQPMIAAPRPHTEAPYGAQRAAIAL